MIAQVGDETVTNFTVRAGDQNDFFTHGFPLLGFGLNRHGD
jgi:hypothetical protein